MPQNLESKLFFTFQICRLKQHCFVVEARRELAYLRAMIIVCSQCDQIWRFIGIWLFFKALATINLPKSPKFLGNFCKGVKNYHFSSEISFRQLFIDIWWFFSGHTASVWHYLFAKDSLSFLIFCPFFFFRLYLHFCRSKWERRKKVKARGK